VSDQVKTAMEYSAPTPSTVVRVSEFSEGRNCDRAMGGRHVERLIRER
jgi:hypothetical protein